MSNSWIEKTALTIFHGLTGTAFADEKPEKNHIKVDIIGAGSVGAMLEDELIQNPKMRVRPH